MNKDDLIKKLENLNLPEVEIPSHQRRLKTVLLNFAYFRKQSTRSLIKKFAPVGMFAIVAVLLAGITLLNKPSSRTTDVKALISKSMETLKSKAGIAIPESKGVIIREEPDSQKSFLNSLREVGQTKSLASLGYKFENDKKVKILRFTNDKDNTTILRIEGHKLPSDACCLE